MSTVCFFDYDCIGFDLDHTLCRYKIEPLTKLIYSYVSKYLVGTQGYSKTNLMKPLQAGTDFLRKGLIIDIPKGNILDISSTGTILKASHGTSMLTDEEIKDIYGKTLTTPAIGKLIKDPRSTFDHSSELFVAFDYFKFSFPLLFGRAVDGFGPKQSVPPEYKKLFNCIIEAISEMFDPQNEVNPEKTFYNKIKGRIGNYCYKCSADLIDWLNSLKDSGKILFLLSSSPRDTAVSTASHALGSDWRNFFDISIFRAHKVMFFTQKKRFTTVKAGSKEYTSVDDNQIDRYNIYDNGNWPALYEFLKTCTRNRSPRVIYLGDHFMHDVYNIKAVKQTAVCVCEELQAENLMPDTGKHPEEAFLTSTLWGPLIGDANSNKYWKTFVNETAALSVPSVEAIAKYPITYAFPSKKY